jgi:hypothetical protein
MDQEDMDRETENLRFELSRRDRFFAAALTGLLAAGDHLGDGRIRYTIDSALSIGKAAYEKVK